MGFTAENTVVNIWSRFKKVQSCPKTRPGIVQIHVQLWWKVL